MKIKRVLRWAIGNGAIVLLIWLAVTNNVGAGRLLAFFSWFLAVIMFVAASNDDIKEKTRRRGRPIPGWLSHMVGYSMVFTLVWYGWWFTALACLLSELCEAAIYDDGDNDGKETI